MAATRANRIKAMLLAQSSQKIRPDQSLTLFTFEDNWTIRALQTAGDFRREAYLMRSCTNDYVYNDIPCEQKFSMQNRTELHPSMQGHLLCSLRDEDNLPHASFWLVPFSHAFCASGYRNSKLKRQYLEKLDMWALSTSIKNHGEMHDENLISLKDLVEGNNIPQNNLVPIPHAKRVNQLQKLKKKLLMLQAYLDKIDPQLTLLEDQATWSLWKCMNTVLLDAIYDEREDADKLAKMVEKHQRDCHELGAKAHIDLILEAV